MYAGLRWCTWSGAKAMHIGLQTRNSHTCPYNTLLDVLVLFVVPSSEDFPPISPLQLLLLCPYLLQALHCLEMLALLLVDSLGSRALFFLGLPGDLLLIGV